MPWWRPSSQVTRMALPRCTVTSKVGLTTHIVVQPGNLTVTVVYKVKPQPAPTPKA
jgi:hypothetical protein